MQEIHSLSIKLYVLSNISKYAQNWLPELLARDEQIISIICVIVGVTGKC